MHGGRSLADRRLRPLRTLAGYALTVCALVTVASCVSAPHGDFAAKGIAALDASTLQARLAAGELSAVAVIQAYLTRIERIDDAGPMLNAVIEVNPDALSIARSLDAEFAERGPVGPLHGLPVLLKANIDTGDAMATSAGSLALASHRAPRDAFIVRRLRDAGAIILGKTNMSEWANFRSFASTSGWSSIEGQTRNPHVLDRSPCGSSSGSGAAVAAGLAPLAVGTETDGSVICPSGMNGIAGIKPTLGILSREGIIPIAPSQDTAGSMAQTVDGAALLLESMLGFDADDPGAREIPTRRMRPDPTRTRLDGVRIGVVRSYFGAGDNPRVEAQFEEALIVLQRLGATMVDPVAIELSGRQRKAEFTVLLHEFKASLNAYLGRSGVAADRDTLSELIAFNEQAQARVMPIFDQSIFSAAEATQGLDAPEYLAALAESGVALRSDLETLFAGQALHALVLPSNGLAFKTDWVAGDKFSLGSASFAAMSGYPSVSVPAGLARDLPVGVSFVGRPLEDAALIQIAYAFERATLARREPRYLSTLER